MKNTKPAALFKTQAQMKALSMQTFDQTRTAKRIQLEQFIQDVYHKYYEAHLSQFYPSLLAIETPQNKIKAVAGIRCAADEPLFSEYYLSQSLETILQSHYQCAVSRRDVVEVGNLAPANVGQMRWLIASMISFLHGAGFKVIVFTLVTHVINAFKKMDLPLEQLSHAHYEALPPLIKKQWGAKYYQLNPKVMTGNIAIGYQLMAENIALYHQNLMPLFEKAYQLGQQFKTQMNPPLQNVA